jgi:hypothetical protein
VVFLLRDQGNRVTGKNQTKNQEMYISYAFSFIFAQKSVMLNEFQTVEKEQVAALHFPASEVLHSETGRKQRQIDLERAIALGNLEQHKVKIYFEDTKRKYMVHTTIWAVTEEAIVLKKNVTIPIRRIHKLEI